MKDIGLLTRSTYINSLQTIQESDSSSYLFNLVSSESPNGGHTNTTLRQKIAKTPIDSNRLMNPNLSATQPIKPDQYAVLPWVKSP